MPIRRRDLLITAGAVAATMAAPRIVKMFQSDFTFEPIPGLPGFRRIPGGSVSATQAAFVGIDPITDLQSSLRQQATNAPCQAAFGAKEWPGSAVPIAVFTDYNCPYCPTHSALIRELAQIDASLAVTWHEFPVLGPRSLAAAHAALAARAQGEYLPVHEHLMRTVLRPGPAALASLADRFGMDKEQFAQDFQSAETELQLERSRALTAILGIIGTPAALVGRTLTAGEIDRDRLERLIEVERNAPALVCTGAGAT